MSVALRRTESILGFAYSTVPLWVRLLMRIVEKQNEKAVLGDYTSNG